MHILFIAAATVQIRKQHTSWPEDGEALHVRSVKRESPLNEGRGSWPRLASPGLAEAARAGGAAEERRRRAKGRKRLKQQQQWRERQQKEPSKTK